MLFVDSADKAARFVWCCDAFNMPLLFLADVPGFMVGTQVEAQGIIRHGAKMVTAISEATVPKICVVVRKAYGAGLYAMSRPGLRAGGDHRAAHRQDRGDGARGRRQRGLRQPDRGHRRPGGAGGVHRGAAPALHRGRRPAAPGLRAGDRRGRRLEDLRDELVRRFELADGKDRSFSDRRHGVPPSSGLPVAGERAPAGYAGRGPAGLPTRSSSATSGPGTGCSPRRRSPSRAGCG